MGSNQDWGVCGLREREKGLGGFLKMRENMSADGRVAGARESSPPERVQE